MVSQSGGRWDADNCERELRLSCTVSRQMARHRKAGSAVRYWWSSLMAGMKNQIADYAMSSSRVAIVSGLPSGLTI
jgi:hypothetical protein